VREGFDLTGLEALRAARDSGRLAPDVALPEYDRARLRAGIAHIGVGNFHRAHEGLFVDRCLHLDGQADWAICGIGLGDSHQARAKAEAYKHQSGLFTLTEFAPTGEVATRVIGAMIEYIHAPSDPEAVAERLSDPAIRIVSLTMTEGGYNIDETNGEFRLDQPDVASDLSGAPLRTAFGFITEALARRRDRGTAPFTVLSCDNLRHNGDTARLAFTSFARARDPELAGWIDATVAFPNSMVDRIAPRVSDDDRAMLNDRSGIDDRLPVIAETFIQWVVQDRFPAGRPALEAVGVELRDDVSTFEKVKGRMLNASHMLMAYPSLLAGYRMVHEAVADQHISRLVDDFMELDAIPLLVGPPGLSLVAYKDLIIERFSNPAIRDQVLRIAHDGASKIPVFHSATLATLVERGRPLEREAFFVACFGRYLRGRDDQGSEFDVQEPHLTSDDWGLIRSGDPLDLLRTGTFRQLALDDTPAFREPYLRYVAALASDGVRLTLDRLTPTR